MINYIDKLLKESIECNNKAIEAINEIKQISLNKEISDILINLDDDNIEECIDSIVDVICYYNIDDIVEDELEDYAKCIAIELVSNELRCNLLDRSLFS